MVSTWRGYCKVAAFYVMSEWEITPTDHQKRTLNMTPEDVLAFTRARIIELLLKDAFCDDGKNPDVSIYNHIVIRPLIPITGPSGSL